MVRALVGDSTITSRFMAGDDDKITDPYPSRSAHIIRTLLMRSRARSDGAPVADGAAERNLVCVLEVSADGKTVRDTADGDAGGP